MNTALQHLLQADELGLYDFGSVKVVYPTGRYIDATENGPAEYCEPRLRFMVEIREKTFMGVRRWVPAFNLRTIQEAKDD